MIVAVPVALALFVVPLVTVNEGAGTATFTVSLSSASGLPVSVDYATAQGTATAGADYTTTTGTLNFAPGTTSLTITVPILNDNVFEGSENFTVNLTKPVNATIATSQGVGTIEDNGTGTGGTDNDHPELSVSNVTVTEGANRFAVFTVSLSNPSEIPITASLQLKQGTATGGGIDYGASGAANIQVSTDGGKTWQDATTVTFAPGTMSVQVRTEITADNVVEGPEKFTLNVADISNIADDPSGTATILDASHPPVVIPPPVQVPTHIPNVLPPAPAPFVFAYDTFHDFATETNSLLSPFTAGPVTQLTPVDNAGPAILPLAPIYSGEADPGSTLVIELYNANGVRIATQMVMADAGGNWLANFGGATLRDAPSDVRITQVAAPYAFGGGAGHNLRTYYAPAAINPGHFVSQTGGISIGDEAAPLLGGLDLANPIQLGDVKYGGEFLPSEGVASGN